jgi:hypothetical protein
MVIIFHKRSSFFKQGSAILGKAGNLRQSTAIKVAESCRLIADNGNGTSKFCEWGFAPRPRETAGNYPIQYKKISEAKIPEFRIFSSLGAGTGTRRCCSCTTECWSGRARSGHHWNRGSNRHRQTPHGRGLHFHYLCRAKNNCHEILPD